MSEQNRKDQKSKVTPSTEAPGVDSAELQAALERFTRILDKAAVPPEAEDKNGSTKPLH